MSSSISSSSRAPAPEARVIVSSHSIVIDETAAEPAPPCWQLVYRRYANPGCQIALFEQQIDDRLKRPLARYETIPLATVVKPHFEGRLFRLVDLCFDQHEEVLRIPAREPLELQAVPLTRYFESLDQLVSLRPHRNCDDRLGSAMSSDGLDDVRARLARVNIRLDHAWRAIQTRMNREFPPEGGDTDWSVVLHEFFSLSSRAGPEEIDRTKLFSLACAANAIDADVIITPGDWSLALVPVRAEEDVG